MKQSADQGEGEAQFSLGHILFQAAGGADESLGAAGRSPEMDVRFRTSHQQASGRSPLLRRVDLMSERVTCCPHVLFAGANPKRRRAWRF